MIFQKPEARNEKPEPAWAAHSATVVHDLEARGGVHSGTGILPVRRDEDRLEGLSHYKKTRRGVALVITLLMLSVVTFMAVIFLGVSRRETVSIGASSDLTDARLMADAALARAQAELVSRVLAAGHAGAIDYIPSTNYLNLAGLTNEPPGRINPINTSYWRIPNTNLYPPVEFLRPNLSKLQRIQAIANLQYDPRPPVFVRTNFTLAANNPLAWDFRYFLDLNRNGLADLTWPVSLNRRAVNLGYADPQWIGMLEYPDVPHSETNRFIGRYAFVVLPSGKSLDLNTVHNYSKALARDMPLDGFIRNQGVGPWEMNLGAFFRDLNPEIWDAASYQYNAGAGQNRGVAFDDAVSILRFRYQTNFNNLASAFFTFGNRFNDLVNAGIDLYGDRPLRAPDSSLPWAGNENPSVMFDPQDLFDPGYVSADLARRLDWTRTNYSFPARETFYRMISQLTTDSRPSVTADVFFPDFRRRPTNKFNLNFQPMEDPALRAQGLLWDPTLDWSPPPLTAAAGDPRGGNPLKFFYGVADRLIRASLKTNVMIWNGAPVTNFYLGGVPVRPDISITNIQVYHTPVPTNVVVPYWTTNVEYTATLHRLLQLAANIYDATTTRTALVGRTTVDYPTVFRPVVTRQTSGNSTNFIISGFTEISNAVPTNIRWRDLRRPVDQTAFISGDGQNTLGDNVAGVPWVVGAKKGFPNFNEFSMENYVQVTRRLRLDKAGGGRFITNQQHSLSVSNVLGVELWNSYTNRFERTATIVVSNEFSYALATTYNGLTNIVYLTNGVASARLTTNNWAGRGAGTVPDPASFLLPLQTNVLFITNAHYLTSQPTQLYDPARVNPFEQQLDPPQLRIYLTNNLRYWLIDQNQRIVDFVNLDGLNTYMDISQALLGGAGDDVNNFFGSTAIGQAASIQEGDVWRTNRLNALPTTATAGIINQMAISLGDPRVASDIWQSHATVGEFQKDAEIAKFRYFMLNTGDTNRTAQAPYAPTRRIYQRFTWQANDPLVHYTKDDLTDVALNSPNGDNFAYLKVRGVAPDSNLRRLNERYRPWGGNPMRQTAGRDALHAFSTVYKDPSIRASDDWIFPSNKFANLGWLGRVHRGTPWQTMFLKSHLDPANGQPVSPQNWQAWSGSADTHPTEDWKLFELFTVAPNATATRGLMAVNQTNVASWSALLSGVQIPTNTPAMGAALANHIIEPASPPLTNLVGGIVSGVIQTRATLTNSASGNAPLGVFNSLGELFATPELTVRSPFLNLSNPARIQIRDEVVEAIPQRILSLLRLDEPRVVVYAFGQSLRPAPNSLVTSGNYYNICTNYQITGEVAAKAVLRIDDPTRQPRVVVESFNFLPAP